MAFAFDDFETGEVLWTARTAPQCITGCLIQIADPDGKTLHAVDLFEIIREEIEGNGCLDGTIRLVLEHRQHLARVARNLRRIAAMIDDALVDSTLDENLELLGNKG